MALLCLAHQPASAQLGDDGFDNYGAGGCCTALTNSAPFPGNVCGIPFPLVPPNSGGGQLATKAGCASFSVQPCGLTMGSPNFLGCAYPDYAVVNVSIALYVLPLGTQSISGDLIAKYV